MCVCVNWRCRRLFVCLLVCIVCFVFFEYNSEMSQAHMNPKLDICLSILPLYMARMSPCSHNVYGLGVHLHKRNHKHILWRKQTIPTNNQYLIYLFDQNSPPVVSHPETSQVPSSTHFQMPKQHQSMFRDAKRPCYHALPRPTVRFPAPEHLRV